MNIRSKPSSDIAQHLTSVFSQKGRLIAALLCITVFLLNKISSDFLLDEDFDYERNLSNTTISHENEARKNCQLVYVMGVEGATHHGVSPVVEALAHNQIDPETGLHYVVHFQPQELRKALFGFREKRSVDDPTLVQQLFDPVFSPICPNDGRKHIIIEDSSFPCGHEDDPRTYRVRRQHQWLNSTMEEIANSELALNHPVNLYKMLQAYSPYVDIKFVVLHRPFLETIASHTEWDDNPEGHSNVIRGFMLLLRRFLDANPFDMFSGDKMWTLICTEKMSSKYYSKEMGQESQLQIARQNIVANLAQFLKWPQHRCPHCFDTWKESRKNYQKVLGEKNITILLDHMKEIETIWPPRVDDGSLEQQCEP